MKRVVITAIASVLCITALWVVYDVRYGSISKSITEGSAYGFNIADTKQECFAIMKTMRESSDIRWIEPSYSSDQVNAKGLPRESDTVDAPLALEALDDWLWWKLTFYSNEVASIGVSVMFDRETRRVHYLSTWQGDNYVRDVEMKQWSPQWHTQPLSVGMGYAEVERVLSLYSEHGKGLSRTLRMEPRRFRYIQDFGSEGFSRLRPWRSWKMSVVSRASPMCGWAGNSIRLTFENETLTEIGRYRRPGSFPFGD